MTLRPGRDGTLRITGMPPAVKQRRDDQLMVKRGIVTWEELRVLRAQERGLDPRCMGRCPPGMSIEQYDALRALAEATAAEEGAQAALDALPKQRRAGALDYLRLGVELVPGVDCWRAATGGGMGSAAWCAADLVPLGKVGDVAKVADRVGTLRRLADGAKALRRTAEVARDAAATARRSLDAIDGSAVAARMASAGGAAKERLSQLSAKLKSSGGASRGSTRTGEPASRTAGSIRQVNPTGSVDNCVACAMATDARLAGNPASALPVPPQRISVLSEHFGGAWKNVGGADEIIDMLNAAGPGARGIVYGAPPAGSNVGHVCNAVNQRGAIRFLDGQIGGPASFEGRGFKFLWTNQL